MRAALSAGVLAAALLGLSAGPVGAADPPAALTEVGHDDLGARGLNSALALAGSCAYVGSRGQGPIEIVDVSDPAHPRTVGSLPARSLTTTRELRAVPDQHVLAVLSYSLGRGGANRIDLYRWSGDCTHPSAVGGYDFGGRPPHEFFLWRAPGGERTLLFVSMFSGRSGDLQVLDVSDPAAPRLAGTWAPPVGLLHSVSLSADGLQAYLSLWTGGMLVADASQFTQGRANPQLTLLTPVAARVAAPPGGNVHSAVQVPGTSLLVLTDERYPPACPYGPARLVDVSNPAAPRVVASMAAPENDPATCRNSPVGTYTSHNPTPIGGLALVSWYSSGLQVFDISNPAQPQRLAEFRPQASEPGLRDPQLGATVTMTWSYPIVRDGLIYVADIDEGLYVLRYSGPHQQDLAGIGFAEGNSNLTARAAAPTPTAAGSQAGRTPSPAASARPALSAGRSGLPVPVAAVVVVALAGVAALLAAAGLALRRSGAGRG